MPISKAAIENIATLTVGQTTNDLWWKLRYGRLTASRIGDILTSTTELRLEYIARTMFLQQSDTIPMKYGRENEKTAIQMYESITGTR